MAPVPTAYEDVRVTDGPYQRIRGRTAPGVVHPVRRMIEDVDTNRDHVPSRGLLRKPYPDNLPVVDTCVACNNGFSADEEYMYLFLHCVLTGSTDPEQHPDAKIARALQRHKKLRARIERSKTEYRTIGDETRCVWQPEKERVERVVVKNSRGHAFYEYGEPMLSEPEHVCTLPLVTMTAAEREGFENAGTSGELAFSPEVGSRMMTRVLTGQDMCDGWVIVQEGVYRFRVQQRCGILVRSVLFEYLATEVHWSDHCAGRKRTAGRANWQHARGIGPTALAGSGLSGYAISPDRFWYRMPRATFPLR